MRGWGVLWEANPFQGQVFFQAYFFFFLGVPQSASGALYALFGHFIPGWGFLTLRIIVHLV